MTAQPTPQHPWRKNWGKSKSTGEDNRSEQRDPCEYLMRRLRKQYGLEFIFADLSERGRRKVLEYAALMRDLES